MSRFLRSLADRVWPKVDATGNCWEWTAQIDRDGYGRITSPRSGEQPRRPMLAHRVVYELLIGPIPDGRELDHLCRNRSCVNPDHLEVVSHQENSRRGYSIVGQNARQRMCRRGHPLVMTERSNGKRLRQCPTCRAARQRESYRLRASSSSLVDRLSRPAIERAARRAGTADTGAPAHGDTESTASVQPPDRYSVSGHGVGASSPSRLTVGLYPYDSLTGVHVQVDGRSISIASPSLDSQTPAAGSSR